MPASANAASNSRPAGPTKGLPARSSSLPGCSPTNITLDRRLPSPKTVCVPFFQRSQARQSAAASLSVDNVGRGGIKFSAGLFEDLDENFRVGIWFPVIAGVYEWFINHESSIFKSRTWI